VYVPAGALESVHDRLPAGRGDDGDPHAFAVAEVAALVRVTK
jgi:hypothetical protein